MPPAYTQAQKSAIAQFQAFTKADSKTAAKLLKSHGWQIAVATDAHTRITTTDRITFRYPFPSCLSLLSYTPPLDRFTAMTDSTATYTDYDEQEGIRPGFRHTIDEILNRGGCLRTILISRILAHRESELTGRIRITQTQRFSWPSTRFDETSIEIPTIEPALETFLDDSVCLGSARRAGDEPENNVDGGRESLRRASSDEPTNHLEAPIPIHPMPICPWLDNHLEQGYQMPQWPSLSTTRSTAAEAGRVRSLSRTEEQIVVECSEDQHLHGNVGLSRRDPVPISRPVSWQDIVFRCAGASWGTAADALPLRRRRLSQRHVRSLASLSVDYPPAEYHSAELIRDTILRRTLSYPPPLVRYGSTNTNVLAQELTSRFGHDPFSPERPNLMPTPRIQRIRLYSAVSCQPTPDLFDSEVNYYHANLVFKHCLDQPPPYGWPNDGDGLPDYHDALGDSPPYYHWTWAVEGDSANPIMLGRFVSVPRH